VSARLRALRRPPARRRSPGLQAAGFDSEFGAWERRVRQRTRAGVLECETTT
jgi:hypothetical protein